MLCGFSDPIKPIVKHIHMAEQAKDLSTNPNIRIQQVYKLALDVWQGDQIRARLCVSQAILESALDQPTISKLALKNNLFGIKGKGTAGHARFATIEGKSTRTHANFAANKTLKDSFLRYKTLIESSSTYEKVLTARTLQAAIHAMANSGYATDPHYEAKLIRRSKLIKV